jgi:hypothetical protein
MYFFFKIKGSHLKIFSSPTVLGISKFVDLLDKKRKNETSITLNETFEEIKNNNKNIDKIILI